MRCCAKQLPGRSVGEGGPAAVDSLCLRKRTAPDTTGDGPGVPAGKANINHRRLSGIFQTGYFLWRQSAFQNIMFSPGKDAINWDSWR